MDEGYGICDGVSYVSECRNGLRLDYEDHKKPHATSICSKDSVRLTGGRCSRRTSCSSEELGWDYLSCNEQADRKRLEQHRNLDVSSMSICFVCYVTNFDDNC